MADRTNEGTDEAAVPEEVEEGRGGRNFELPKTLVELIATRSEEVIALIESISSRVLESRQARARFTIRMAWLAAVVMVVIVLVAATLTYLGRIDGSTFTFLLGLVSGYLLTFVQNAMRPDRDG